MNLRRIFANALARRIAYLLVALLLTGLGIGNARAACVPNGAFGAICQYRGEAYAWAQQMGPPAGSATWGCTASQPSLGPPHNVYLNFAGATNGEYRAISRCAGGRTGNDLGAAVWNVGTCPAGAIWDPATNTCGTCEEKPPLGNTAWSGVNASGQMCKDDCVFEGGDNSLCIEQIVDAQSFTRCTNWAPSGDTCSVGSPGGGFPTAPSEAPSDSDNDGTSDGNDTAPNNPGQGGGGEEGTSDEDDAGTCGGVGQPTCGSPGTGSGNGNTSGGGMDCSTPPSSTGDAIAAQIAYQAWATRCAVEGLRKDMGGGDGGSGEEPGGGDAGAVEGSDSIYEGRGDTASDILDSFAAQAQQTALVGAVEAFFAAPPSGSCPVWVLPANAFFDAITFDFHCSGQFATILGYAGWVLMACVAVLAIRIAIT